MITDLQLHAFVDRQLSSQEAGEILSEAARSPELAARIDALQQLKAMLHHAYSAPPVAGRDCGRRLATHSD